MERPHDAVQRIIGAMRSKNRSAPEGYEQQPQWTADYTDAYALNQPALARIMAQREFDRTNAQNAAAQTTMAQTGQWQPMAGHAPGLYGGFMEAMAGSDESAGIESGMPTRNPSTRGRNIMGGGSKMGGTSMALQSLRGRQYMDPEDKGRF